MRWRVLALLALLAALAPPPAAGAAVPVLVVDGKGWGHGVGMAQDGAYWMGAAGSRTNDILGHFYPGTGLGRAGGTVRVAVLDAPSRDTVVVFPGGGEVRDALSGPQSPGFPVTVGPGGQVHVWFDGSRYHAQAGGAATMAAATRPAGITTSRAGLRAQAPPTTPTTGPTIPPPSSTSTTGPPSTVPPLTTTTTRPAPRPPPPSAPPPPSSPPPPSPAAPATSPRPLWSVPSGNSVTSLPARSRQYRGVIQITATGPLHLVNQIDVEQYLRGMGEVRDPGWPQSSLRVQAIAARTYALRAVAAGGEICDDDRCQVYLGQQAEYPAMDKAVADSRGQVVTFGGGLASTVYSANAGGFSATSQEGFGTAAAGYPYLRAAPYLTKDPDPWTVRIGLPDLAARLGYPGQLQGAHVAGAGPSGRALQVSLDGTTGPLVVDAHRFASGLGLRSTLITLRLEQDEAAPPPPAPADLIQVPPDQLAPAAPAPDSLPPAPALPKRAVVLNLPGGGQGRWPWVALAFLLLPAWLLGATKFAPGLLRPAFRRT